MNKQKNYLKKTKLRFKSIRLVSLILVTALLLSCFSACKNQPTNDELIENRINSFVEAYNNGDMDALLSHLDAKSSNTLEATLNLAGGLAGGLTGFDLELSDLFSLGIGTYSSDFMNLEIIEINYIDSTNAFATTTVELAGSKAKTIQFVMVYENDGWYINDMTDKISNNSNQAGTNINVSDIISVYYGNGEIEFNMDGKTYEGIVNSKGEIIYYADSLGYMEWTPMGDGAGFVTSITEDDKKIYTIFNTDGQKTLTVNGDVFDTVLGYGDGLILVHKNNSTLTTVEHTYGVLDYNGKWIKPLTAGTELPDPNIWDWETFNHVVDGTFISYGYFNGKKQYLIFNSDTNKSYLIISQLFGNYNYPSNFDEYIFNGKIYGYYGGTISDYSNQSNRTGLPSFFELHTDGTFEEISEFTYAFGNLLINTKGEFMRVFDKSTNTEKEWTAFPSNIINNIHFEDGYLLVLLNGVDGKTYFTVIDKDCNEIITPTVCRSATLSNGRIVYENESKIYEVIDVNGNSIVTANEGYTNIGKYSGGIAKAENSNGECIIGLDGKPLTITLK